MENNYIEQGISSEQYLDQTLDFRNKFSNINGDSFINFRENCRV